MDKITNAEKNNAYKIDEKKEKTGGCIPRTVGNGKKFVLVHRRLA